MRLRITDGDSALRTLFRFLKDESAVSNLEFGVVAAGVVATIIAAVNSMGTHLNGTFNETATTLK